MLEKVNAANVRHTKPAMQFTYGTAGFRLLGRDLDSTMFRMGLLAGIRSRYLGGKAIGVMVTASHNPPQDNGVKLVDPDGEMLESSWETYATELANADNLGDCISQLVSTLNVDLNKPARCVYARDSRDSGPALVKALCDGLEAIGCQGQDFGMLTTPQLHYLVKCANDPDYGKFSEEGYFDKLVDAFKVVCGSTGTSSVQAAPMPVIIDGANGIGGPKVKILAARLNESNNGANVASFDIVNSNTSQPEALNVSCGADFVKTNQKPPQSVVAKPGQLCASLDGDADRIVFFYMGENGSFHLLDGDKIATLIASYLQEQVQQLGQVREESNGGNGARIGVVQTAYANGSSTEYLIGRLNVPVECTKTGVKHLHHAAQTFDVGVYFEANGHGTVLFRPEFVADLKTREPCSPAEKSAIDALVALSNLANQTVGDALSDLLVVLAVLNARHWGPVEWDQSYTDLPNRLAKVQVGDRNEFTTTDAERKLVTPSGLQQKLDDLVSKYSQGRAFIRASGTENVVRVYAEAATHVTVDELVAQAVKLVEQYK